MENIKQRFSDFVHSWTVIAMITLFLFAVKPETMPHAEALVVKPQIKTAQLKKETLEKYSNTVYKPSESLTPKELKNQINIQNDNVEYKIKNKIEPYFIL